MGTNYLITGATGFVGRYIMKKLLEQSIQHNVYLLIRHGRHITAEERMLRLMQEVFSAVEMEQYRSRIKVVAGNITESQLGLSTPDYQYLSGKINVIFHSAATIKFNLSLAEATEVNIEGTRHIISFAYDGFKNGQLTNVYHISTAYVAGRKSSLAQQDTVFANTYEKTKHGSELLLGEFKEKGVPITIFRPSIISGNTLTGEITSSTILFRFLAMLSRRSLHVLPGPTTLNIISLNNFLDFMFDIIAKPESVGQTFNITNPKNEGFETMVEYACELLQVPVPKFIPLRDKHLLPTKTLNQIGVFMPYFEDEHNFDLTNTLQILGRNELVCDEANVNIKQVLTYCYQHKLLTKKESHLLRDPSVLPYLLARKSR
ncbi:MAG: SDR family oxidoreductase [Bacteroidota bacterium]